MKKGQRTTVPSPKSVPKELTQRTLRTRAISRKGGE
jgi:hypothetical protein